MNHDLVEFLCQSRRGREAIALVNHFDDLWECMVVSTIIILHNCAYPVRITLISVIMCSNLRIAISFKWFVSETPYLIHDTTKAPHITGSGVLLVVEGLQ